MKAWHISRPTRSNHISMTGSLRCSRCAADTRRLEQTMLTFRPHSCDAGGGRHPVLMLHALQVTSPMPTLEISAYFRLLNSAIVLSALVAPPACPSYVAAAVLLCSFSAMLAGPGCLDSAGAGAAATAGPAAAAAAADGCGGGLRGRQGVVGCVRPWGSRGPGTCMLTQMCC
jgi:hypothetical protein